MNHKQLSAELAMLQRIKDAFSPSGLWKSSRFERRYREVIQLIAKTP